MNWPVCSILRIQARHQILDGSKRLPVSYTHLDVYKRQTLERFARIEDVDPPRFAAVLWISQRAMPDDYAVQLAGKAIVYRPGGAH